MLFYYTASVKTKTVIRPAYDSNGLHVYIKAAHHALSWKTAQRETAIFPERGFSSFELQEKSPWLLTERGIVILNALRTIRYYFMSEISTFDLCCICSQPRCFEKMFMYTIRYEYINTGKSSE